MGRVLSNDRGSILILTVIAMLIMGVLSVSFALLAEIETKIGVNYKQQGQAEALAEAGLERARDAIRGAISTSDGFTGWINTVVVTDTLGAGQYEARVDNDCPPFVPAAIQQPTGGSPAVSCPTNTDLNEVAVITARAVAGSGRARVRAILGVDNPWKHVCSAPKGDNGGYCNDPANQNGSPVITPADANDPNGPAAYDELPRPTLGCSKIDPTMHNASFATCGLTNPDYDWNPTVGGYRSGGGAAPPAGVRLVVTGGRTAGNCDAPGGNPLFQYSGYFDCALTTPCRDVTACNPTRPACVRAGDPRIGAWYAAVNAGGCPEGATGMVFNWFAHAPAGRTAAGIPPKVDQERNPIFDGTVGGCSGATSGPTFDCVPPLIANGRNIYVLRGDVGNGGPNTGQVKIEKSGGGESYVYGTLVLEGEGLADGCGEGAGSARDLKLLNRGVVTTAQTNTTEDPDRPVYGYPLAVIIFDPLQALGLDPPVRPLANPYDPQNTCADMGSANTAVNGMIYSGGHVQFNPIQVNGSVVAFEIQTQGGANAGIGYNRFYGTFTPPPGFPAGAGNQVAIIRKSFVVCTNYETFTGACN